MCIPSSRTGNDITALPPVVYAMPACTPTSEMMLLPPNNFVAHHDATNMPTPDAKRSRQATERPEKRLTCEMFSSFRTDPPKQHLHFDHRDGL